MLKKLLLITLLAVTATVSALAQDKQKVEGVVVDGFDGSPLPGATVVVTGNPAVGVSTDYDGKFALMIPANTESLTIGFVGMTSQVVKPEFGKQMRIVLKEDAELVDEVVVMGYGSAKKLGSVTGSVATITADKLENIPVANFTDALQGQVAGLSVLSGSGEPSAVSSIRMRGVNSINAGVEPLFILDGSPISYDVFNSLNPADIASFSILKDASSTAIYGSRAANGVIVLTSKKGKMGEKATVRIGAQYGVSNMINNGVDMMNSTQYMRFQEILNPALLNDATWLQHKNVVTQNGINTDWVDYVFRDNVPTYQLKASVTGGSENSNYYLSLNQFSKEGIEPMSSVGRTSLRFNEDIRVSEKFKLGFDVNLSYNTTETNPESNNTYTSNPTVFSRIARPDDSPRYYTVDPATGKALYGDRADFLHYSKIYNPEYSAENRNRKDKTVHLDASIYEQYTPIKGLVLRASQALSSYDNQYTSIFYPTDAYVSPMGDLVDMYADGSSASRAESAQRYWQITATNTAEYTFSLNKAHNFTVLLGQEAIVEKANAFSVSRAGLTDRQLLLLTNATEEPTVSQSMAETVVNSFFGEVSYNYAEKYFLNASLRRDGSSKFSEDHRWSTFWSVGARWNMMKEKFMDPFASWLNQLDIKASYGTTGNSSIGNYAYFGLASGAGVQYNGNAGLIIAQPSIKDLTWETVAQTNIGFETRVFDRVTLGVEYYHKKTTDMLLSIPYSYTTGFSSGDGNIGAMVNKGVDLSVNIDIIKRPDMYWGFTANANYNKNEITELFNGLDEYVIANTGIKLQVGKPYGEFYTVKRSHIDPRDGKQVWFDADGNLTKKYNEAANSVFTGKQRFAPWTGGFGTNFTWKGLSVVADFTWVLGKYAMNNDRYFYENAAFGTTYNQSVEMLNVWTTPGQVTDIPAASEQLQFDDHLLENASFMRLKNLTIGYNLPSKWFGGKNFVSGVNVFVTGRNLITWTDFTGYDPEPDTNMIRFNYPNTREYIIGCEITF